MGGCARDYIHTPTQELAAIFGASLLLKREALRAIWGSSTPSWAGWWMAYVFRTRSVTSRERLAVWWTWEQGEDLKPAFQGHYGGFPAGVNPADCVAKCNAVAKSLQLWVLLLEALPHRALTLAGDCVADQVQHGGGGVSTCPAHTVRKTYGIDQALDLGGQRSA